MKKNIVLIHGWGANIDKLEPLAGELNKFKWQVLIPQLPGFDAKPPKEVWNLDRYAKYVADIAEKQFNSENYFVFGHSFGGGVGIKLALSKPEKIDGLILCSARGISRTNVFKRYLILLFAKIGKVFLLVPPVARSWKKILYKAVREHDYEKSQGIMKEVFKKIISEDLKPSLANLKVPVLVLWGKDDKMTPFKDALFIKSKMPKAKLSVYENVGHRLPYIKYADIAGNIEDFSLKKVSG